MLEICQEDNLTQRRKDAKKNQVFRTEDAKIFGLNCGFALAILTLLGNESALPLLPTPYLPNKNKRSLVRHVAVVYSCQEHG